MKNRFTTISCSWQDEKNCEQCGNRGKLHCRWKASDLLVFNALVLPAMLGGIIGAVLIGMEQAIWWPLITYILFFPVVLGLAETRFLCSHCPFYAEEGKMLKCLANHGFLKIWRYHPEPMNRLERGLMIVLLVVFPMIPVLILGYNIWYFHQSGAVALMLVVGITTITVLSLVAFFLVMWNFICTVCVNFSCPFNRVEEKYVNAYLEKNPVMKKAWKA